MTDLSSPSVSTGAGAAERWSEYEARYLEGRYDGGGGVDAVLLAPGTVPVLITAGHAVTHSRLGARKPADMATGGLAELLSHSTGATALTVTGMPAADPNFDPTGHFKDRVLELLPHVSAVLDLHGMSNNWGPDICLGLGATPNLARDLAGILADELARAGFSISWNDPYSAEPPATITSTVQAAGTAAVQLELARRVRDPWGDTDASQRLVDALIRAVARMAG